jgi:fatty-acyl-CoA synthase
MSLHLPYANLLDTVDPLVRPSTATHSSVEHIESVPWAKRCAVQSTYQAIKLAAQHRGDAPAIIMLARAEPEDADDPAHTTSFVQLIEGVHQAANLFHELGVGPGEVVSLLMPLLPQTFFALYGAQAAGIANPVNSFLEPHQIAEILQAANTTLLVALGPTDGSDIWDKVLVIGAQVPSLKAIVMVRISSADHEPMEGGEVPTYPSLGSIPVVDFANGCARQAKDHLISKRSIEAHEVAGYFHTGGTTGTPKLVRHSHSNQLFQAWAVTLMVPGPQDMKLLFGLPLFHVGGSLTQGLALLGTGRTVVIVSGAGWRHPNAVRNVWHLVDRFRPPVLGGVPTVLAAAQSISSQGCDTSSVKLISGGGSAIPVAVAQAMTMRFDAPVLEVYGMTETSSVHTISHIDREVRLGSVGHAVPYARVRVVKLNAQGQWAGECAVDEIGVVAMAGPGVFEGYLSDLHNAGAFIEPGWVNSGDLGRLDSEGYLWITGRAKDLIIRGGHNIDPLAIEEVFYQHPAVALAAVVGQPDAYAGELPVAYVQLKAGSMASSEELLAHVKRGTPERAAVPVAIHIVPALPLTAVGKVFKPQLRWSAAELVFTELLRPFIDLGARIKVSVGADGTHGSLARIFIETCPAHMTRDALAHSIEARLSPFTLRHLIE